MPITLHLTYVLESASYCNSYCYVLASSPKYTPDCTHISNGLHTCILHMHSTFHCDWLRAWQSLKMNKAHW